MKVIIVGNGSSLLEYEKGQEIDSFDIIVRFNAYTIEGYEKHVGTITHYWFNTIAFVDKQNFRYKTEYKKIIWHCWNWNEEKEFGFLTSTFNNVEKTKIETIREIQEYVGNKQYFNYSTGAIAIWMMLKEYNDITLIGFDWWENKAKHHYNDSAKLGNIHKPDKEFFFINKLLKENKIKFLK